MYVTFVKKPNKLQLEEVFVCDFWNLLVYKEKCDKAYEISVSFNIVTIYSINDYISKTMYVSNFSKLHILCLKNIETDLSTKNIHKGGS